MNEDDMSDEQLTGIEEEQQILFESIREQNLKKMMEKFRGVQFIPNLDSKWYTYIYNRRANITVGSP